MDKLVVILGPTAVGKTDVCLHVAEHFGIPIINADSRQMFQGIAIGTAAPTPDELSRVKHFFVGSHHLDDYYSASRFEADVIHLLQNDPLFTHSRLALMSGGSMMYIDAVCDGIDDIPTIHDETRLMMKHRLEEEGLERLVEELRQLDPDYYAIVDRRNTRRVIHALEICHQTGRTYTSYRIRNRASRWFDILKIGLYRERKELYTRINQRVEKMVEHGFVDEALRVYPYRHENSLNTVGFKEMFEYLDGLCTLENAVTRIQGNTRKYCRKQLTWLKRDKTIKWFHPDSLADIILEIESFVHDNGEHHTLKEEMKI